jgi:glycosyltransferase involved in cell wall biosynthesis
MNGRIKVKGKFLFDNTGQKFILKGVTYGTFRPDSDGFLYPNPAVVLQDLELMRQAGINTIRVYTQPPHWLLDYLQEFDIRLLLGIDWPQHTAFLDSSAQKREVHTIVREAVRDLGAHPAVLGYMIGNEIKADIVRWYGATKIQHFLNEIYDEVKDIDGDALVSYANYPTTEYLELPFLDFLSYNVYLHREEDYRRYILRLHSIAESKPLVLSEFGVDSTSEGIDEQARIVSGHLKIASELGAAGNVVFSWTDEWYCGGQDILDWHFGLVSCDRSPKPAFNAVAEQFKNSIPPAIDLPPLVSVVVCAYNAERTMHSCLASLQHLNYPNYEVIVVNDGSTDKTQLICNDFSYIRLINQENMGLSVARNVGLEAALGEIVAYTDSDCDADPDWLNYIVTTFKSTGLSAVGGPNFPPPEDSLVPSVVAVSPGGPTHVLLTDDTAEHIAGCNMAFYKSVLSSIGGFDPQFRAAGDDVDICWRLQDAGYTIGFSPSAIVWHFRRNTVRDYLNQQRGYGKAEAMVYLKHPNRFNQLGQARWLGRIYGDVSMSLMPTRPVIYSGVFGQALFQTLYSPPAPVWSYLPFTLEWNFLALVFLCSISAVGINPLWALPPFLITLVACLLGAAQAKIEPVYQGLHGYLLVAYLLFMGPIVRGIERYKWRFILASSHAPRTDAARISTKMISLLPRSLNFAYWSTAGVERDHFLTAIIPLLESRKFYVSIESGWRPWDLLIGQGLWAKSSLITSTEHHGSGKTLTRIRIRPQRTSAHRAAMVTLVAGIIFFYLFKLSQAALFLFAMAILIYFLIWMQKALLLYRLAWCIQSVAGGLDVIDLNHQDPSRG